MANDWIWQYGDRSFLIKAMSKVVTKTGAVTESEATKAVDAYLAEKPAFNIPEDCTRRDNEFAYQTVRWLVRHVEEQRT